MKSHKMSRLFTHIPALILNIFFRLHGYLIALVFTPISFPVGESKYNIRMLREEFFNIKFIRKLN